MLPFDRFRRNTAIYTTFTVKISDRVIVLKFCPILFGNLVKV